MAGQRPVGSCLFRAGTCAPIVGIQGEGAVRLVWVRGGDSSGPLTPL